ncbi:MAG: AbrB/MazE/SpoVT family DNA-binding domain-containing protein [Actinomycetes bacterium]|jgi:AbrB family looped-hinge helix DNA binding protein
MRVTSKGQVTIPIEVRNALGIKAGSEVEFKLDEGGARLLPGGGERADSISRMRGAGEGDMTTDQILALTRR